MSCLRFLVQCGGWTLLLRGWNRKGASFFCLEGVTLSLVFLKRVLEGMSDPPDSFNCNGSCSYFWEQMTELSSSRVRIDFVLELL